MLRGMEEQHYPILEFDPAATAIIEPARILAPIDIAPHCVLCFFQDVISRLRDEGRLQQRYTLGSEMGPNPLYELDFNGRRLALFHPGVGAALAGAFLEELIALGCRHFIACGGCGVLDGTIAVGHVVVPLAAVRDEGVSYHYLPPSREVEASLAAVTAIQTTLERHAVPYLLGKTWTTDGIYRETHARMARRRAEGCLTVEMEAAAFFAVAQFRGVACGQLLYGGDDLSGEVWDGRQWQKDASVREKLFWLAAEACLLL
jgi:uridine phosphorylase